MLVEKMDEAGLAHTTDRNDTAGNRGFRMCIGIRIVEQRRCFVGIVCTVVRIGIGLDANFSKLIQRIATLSLLICESVWTLLAEPLLYGICDFIWVICRRRMLCHLVDLF